jgi:hypothetical protein
MILILILILIDIFCVLYVLVFSIRDERERHDRIWRRIQDALQ